ncbi:glycosyltransferase family 61 protein [Methyloligella sp. 2.7D]|uniref:glycosyltransferase 61 family protein n=1 Tax=unclassified Methyloligella TaxID=2625955 RepID=UPI00157C025E|nr:glycosyltransferase family 61 protein [Methyloligella sp. GL2]QKP78031.1 glycosyltransferase family 61 protein [Methyloligella sp. GL2]
MLSELKYLLGLKTRPNAYWLNIRNNGGSVEHYYHFLLGYLLPLCGYAEEEKTEAPILLARACGPLSRLVCEVGIPGLVLCEPYSHSLLSSEAEKLRLENVDILGLDCSEARREYDADRLASVAALAKRYIQQRLGDKIDRFCEELDSNWTPSPRLLLIKREAPDPFYQSDLAETKGAGTDRRSIANMAELIAALSGRFPQTKVVSLQGRGLAEQIALFKMADIVVAQHGAALANIVWMRPETQVFEFLPDPAQHIFFQNLSPIFGIEHHVLAQEDRKGPVDVAALMDAVASNLRSSARPALA